MEIKAVIYFMAVVEQRSFTLAAKQHGVTQPALSSQISQLEAELGVELFERMQEGVRPTIYGKRLYDEVLPTVRNIVGLVEGSEYGDDRIVRFGMPPGLCQTFLPNLIDAFFREYPSVSVEVKEGYSADLSRDVEAGALDFAVCSCNPHKSGLKLEFAFEEALHLVCARDIAGPSGTPCRLDAIPDLHLCCVAETHPLGELIAHHISTGNICSTRTAIVDGASLSPFILAASWATIVPSSVIRSITASGISFVYPVQYPTISYQVYGISNNKKPLCTAADRMKHLLLDALSTARLGTLSVYA